MMELKERNYGLDFLKIISMFMVCCIHTLNHGGIRDAFAPQESVYWYYNGLYAFVLCAVNCFALVSGYAGIKSKRTNWKRLISLWGTAFFYNLFFTLISRPWTYSSFGIISVLKLFFPVTTRVYWYFSAYFFVFLMIPALRYLINNVEQEKIKRALIAIGTVISLSTLLNSVFFSKDPFNLNMGYSALWLAYLWCVGAFFSKYAVNFNVKKSIMLGGYILASLVLIVSQITAYKVLGRIGWDTSGDEMLIYTSPFCIFAALFLCSTFIKMQFGKRTAKIVSALVPYSFGVYLIHDHPIVRSVIVANSYNYMLAVPKSIQWLFPILFSMLLYCICSGLDFLRQLLFHFVGIHKLIERIGNTLDNLLY